MNYVRAFFEAIPVILAIVAIFTCGNHAITTRRIHDRQTHIAMVVAAVLLICAQSCWTYTVLHGMTFGTFIADVIWTIFNTLVMVTFILSTRRTK